MRPLGRNKFSVELEVGGIERVPGILQHPKGDRPAPAALLLHGFTSRKEDMASSPNNRTSIPRGSPSPATHSAPISR
jgi:hypothetical protein